MSKLRKLQRRWAKNSRVLLAVLFLVAGGGVAYGMNSGVPTGLAMADYTNKSAGAGSDPSFAQSGTVQGISTTQDPDSGHSSSGNALNPGAPGIQGSSVNIQLPASPTSPITVEPEPLPIYPVSYPGCKLSPESPQSLCQPRCYPCGNEMMTPCPLYEGASGVRYPCISPCGYQPGVNIACRVDDSPVGQL